MNSNIFEIFAENVQKHPAKTAIIHRDKTITYETLLQNVLHKGRCLVQKKINKNSKIIVFVPMSIELYEILLALFYIGATAIFLDAWATKNRLDDAIQITGADGFIGIPKAHLLRLKSKRLRKIPVKLFPFELKGKHYKQDIKIAETSPDDIALITFTTGSTGLPKAAKRTHQFLINQHEILTKHLHSHNTDIDMTPLPIFVLHNLAVGSTTVIPSVNHSVPNDFDPDTIFQEINRYKVNTTIGSPVLYERLAENTLSQHRTFPTLKRIYTGGAPVFPPLAQKLVTAFPDATVEIVYGSTEAEPISHLDSSVLAKQGTFGSVQGLLVGQPIEDIQVRIVEITEGPLAFDDTKALDQQTLPTFEVGEICVTGTHVLKEYVNSPEAELENKIKVDGLVWHRTGDAGYRDSSGNLYLMGRVKHRIHYQDQFLYLFPIENQLKTIRGITIGTLIAKKESLSLVIELDKEVVAHPQKVQDDLKQAISLTSNYIFLDKIPRDPRHNSKIDYDKLKTLLQQNFTR